MAAIAKLYRIRGRVQGVGFRWFVQTEATRLGLAGRVRNLDNGEVEVHAQGDAAALDELAGALHRGPLGARVRGVEAVEAAMLHYESFRITR